MINYTDFQTSNGTGALVGATPSTRVATKANTLADWPTAFNGGWFGQAWGPKYDGSDVLNSDGVIRKYNYAGDNFNRFFHTGVTSTTSIALSGGSETQNFRFSYAKLKNNDVLPGTGFSRDNFSMSSNSKFGKKVTLVSKVLYSHEETKNRPIISDSPGNAVQAVYKTMANEDITIFKQGPKIGAVPVGTTTPDAKPVGAEFQRSNDLWGANPYWAAYQFKTNDIRDRVTSSANLKYDITDFLYVSGQAGMDWYTLRQENLTPQGTGYLSGGSMNEAEQRVREINLQWMAGFDKSFSKIHVNAFVGGNRMRNSWERINISGNNFNVPFFAAITNVASKNWDYGYSSSGINSLFGSAEVSYDNYLFLTGTYRKDWFSVLNPHSNSKSYPSVGASFVFTDAFKDLPPILSFGKLRASWGQVGSINAAAGAYSINNTYSLGGTSHLGRPLGYFTRANQTNSGTLPNSALVPLLSSEFEVGLDVRILQNRLGLDLAYYNQETTNDILNANISQASGWTATQVNLGKLTNKGVEVLLTGTPIKGPITWDVSLNFAKNVNKVVSLIAGQTELSDEEPRTRTIRVKHIVGLPYGYITGNIQDRAPDGRLIYDINGTPQTDGKYYQLGTGVANFTGGFNNNITYKSFSLGILFDFKSGGKIYSGTNVRMTGWGFTKQTLQGRDGESPLTVTGAIKSTDASGNTVYTDFTKQLTPGEAQLYWSNFSTRAQDKFMYDASFIKLRQLTFGYSIPKSVLSTTPFQMVTVSVVARNLATLLKHTPNIDPESSYTSSNSQGLDYFGMPPTRSYGFNVRLTF